ncbi:sodium-dependent lysophosphatidylcholine symporter 1-like [Glandiceps talaboti]
MIIQPAHASVVMFGGRAWEAIANPTIGIIINKLDSRFGKMKPWIVFSLPFVMVSFFSLWVVPDIIDDLKFAYYVIMYMVFLTVLTCYNLPYISLTMYLSNNQQDRDSATAYRMVFSMCGTVLANVILSQFLAAVENSDSFDDPFVNTTINETVASTLPPQERNAMERTFMAAALTIIGVALVCSLVLILGTKEKKDIYVSKRGGKDNVWISMKSVFSHRPFIIGLPCFLFSLLTLQMVISNTTLYLLYALHIDLFYYGLIILQVSIVLSMPVWQKLLTKIGKKKTLVIGQLLLIPIMASLLFLPENDIVVAFIFCFLLGTGLSCIQLLPWSMFPDVIDDYFVKTEKRNDAIFYSFFQSFNKLLNGTGLGMSTLVLGFAGYETGASQQPDSVAMTMRILMSVVPICLTLVSMIFLWFFPITDSRINENKAILAKRREEPKSSKVSCEATTSGNANSIPRISKPLED